MLTRLNALWTQMPRWIAAIPAVSVIALAVWAGQGRATGSGVLKVRMGGDQSVTRVVIELQRSAHGTLASGDGLSDQVVVNLDGVSAPDDMHGRGQGLVVLFLLVLESDHCAHCTLEDVEVQQNLEELNRLLSSTYIQLPVPHFALCGSLDVRRPWTEASKSS